MTREKFRTLSQAEKEQLVTTPAHARASNAARAQMREATLETVKQAIKSSDVYILAAAFEELAKREPKAVKPSPTPSKPIAKTLRPSPAVEAKATISFCTGAVRHFTAADFKK